MQVAAGVASASVEHRGRTDGLALHGILDDFAIDVLGPTRSRHLYDLLLERYRTGFVIVTRIAAPTNDSPLLQSGPRPEHFRPIDQQPDELVNEAESYQPTIEALAAEHAKVRGQ